MTPARAYPWELDAAWMTQDLLEGAEKLLENLASTRTQDILAARLGVRGDIPTLQALGERYGLSRERIRQVQEQGLRSSARAAKAHRQCDFSASLLGLVESVGLGPEVVFIELGASLVTEGAGPVLIDLVRRVLGVSKQSLSDVRERVTLLQQLRLAQDSEDSADRWIEEHLIGPAWWPSARAGGLYARRIAPWREVDANGLGRSGGFFSAKMSRVVQYESSLEHGFLLHLEKAPIVVSYQEQPTSIPYEWNGSPRSYIPDCMVLLADGRSLLVEIKPLFQMLDAVNQAKMTAARAWCSRNGVGLLYTDGRVGSRQARQRFVDPQAAARLRARVDAGPVGWREYSAMASDLGINSADLTALGLQSGWRVVRQPWVLYDPANGTPKTHANI